MQKTQKPNVVFILADDLGWMDLSKYGSTYYETPNIDRLADRGMMFTDSYSANPLCSPTRASLMTGKYPGRLRITLPDCHLEPEGDEELEASGKPWQRMIEAKSRRYLPLEEYTLGMAFKDAGYNTAIIGKWHLGADWKYWPGQRGFDLDMSTYHPGPRSYFVPYRLELMSDGPKGEYITDRITDEALNYIEAHKEEPFMLCLWQYALHGPWHAKKDKVEKYQDKKDPRGLQKSPVMAAMIESLDESVGRVIDKLDELGLYDNTVIVFFSDNGGTTFIDLDGVPPTSNVPLRSGKGSIYEGGVRVPLIVSWPKMTRPGSVCSVPVSSVDMYPTLLELAGIAPNQSRPVDGKSFAPLLKGGKEPVREEIFCHFPHYIPALENYPCTSVRQGDWKLIRIYGEGDGRHNAYELYNLKDDIGEKENLAEKMPEKVEELDALITAHLVDIGGVIPVANPAYDESQTMPPFYRSVMPYVE